MAPFNIKQKSPNHQIKITTSYRIAGYFRREFIFRYCKEAYSFENKFLVAAFLRKLIPTTASREDYSVSKRAHVMACRSSPLQTLESMVTRNLFQHSKYLYRHGIHVLHYQLQTPSRSVHMWFYVGKINIRSA